MLPTTILQPGSTDTTSVKALQDYLVQTGYLTAAQKATGYGTYGPQTTAAVAALQKAKGVDNTTGVGYYGPRTIAALQGVATTPTTPTATPAVPSTINSTNTAPTTPIPYTTPTPTPTYPVASLDTTVPTPTAVPTLTPTQQSAQNIIDSLKTFNDSLVGKSAYQAQQDTSAGIPDINATITDLSSQLTGLQNEASSIPLALQNDATGRGITAGGLAPIQTEQLRNNAIKSLTVSTLLDAAKGNLSTAQAKSDAAVAQKYGPIQEQITAATNNLNLILNSPKYSLEEKAQAQDQLNIQNAKQALLDKATADAKIINTVAITAAQNSATFTPTTQYPSVSTALNAIANAKTSVEATQIATAAGLIAPSSADTSVVEVNGRKVLINSKTGATIKDLGAATVATTDDTKNSNTTISSLSSYLIPGQKLADKVTPVLDNTGHITAAAWTALKGTIPASQLPDVVEAYANLFGNNKGIAASGYNFTSEQQAALTKGLPAQ